MSIFICPVPYFLLVSRSFWTFSYFFCALYPFSPAQLRISLWFPENFGLFSAFSVLYVHSHRLSSIFLSSFRRILDFFPAFLSFMSIFICSTPYFSLASGEFWTFLLLFLSLCPFSPDQLRISLWLPENFGLFYCFSRPYVHFLLIGSVFLSGFRMILDFFTAFSVLYVHFLLLRSVFPSGFRMILDFFTAFLGLMSIFICSVQYFLLASHSFWTLFLFFSLLCPYERIRKSPNCDEFGSLQTTKSTETSRL